MKKVISVVLTILCVASCATVPLTPDQQAISAISKAQGQWDVWFDTAHTYYLGHPEKKAEWKEKVIPAFQFTKDSIKLISDDLQKNKAEVTPAMLDQTIAPIMNNLLMLLIQLGVLK